MDEDSQLVAMATACTPALRICTARASFSTQGDEGRPPSTRRKPPVATGFLRPGRERKELMDVERAEQLLQSFDEAHLRRSRGDASVRFDAPEETLGMLRDATVAMCARATHATLGICAASASDGVQTLKGYVSQLGLPRGRLHGMDVNGVAVQVDGPVFIKYNSNTGDADLSGYAGHYRGVLFTPMLADGMFRQYGYLPLSLFEEEVKDV